MRINLKPTAIWMLTQTWALVAVPIAISAEPAIHTELLAALRIPGTASDLSGLDGTLETQSPMNAFGGLSAIEYAGVGNEYWLLSDRGPADGAASFPCRFHRAKIDLHPKGQSREFEIEFKLLSTHLFKSKTGDRLTGSLANLRSWDGKGECPSLDPEGFRRLGSNVIASDEYGPSIQTFGIEGGFVSKLPLPPKFALAERRTPAMQQGTFSNRGLEGLSVTPDQSLIVGAMQGPLVQDGRIENNKCLGVRTRWICYQVATTKFSELLYELDDETTGVSEVLALDNDRFLVLERDSLFADAAKIKKIYLATTESATDISSVESLNNGVPNSVRPIKKQLLIDLLSPNFGLNGPSTPEKPEGLTWGPTLPDGRKLLVVSFDNDFDPAKETILAAFAIAGLD